MISDAVLRIKIYERAAQGLPEDIGELILQVHQLNDLQYPFAEMQYHGLRGYSRDELLRKIKKCREEIVEEETLYEIYSRNSGWNHSVPSDLATNLQRQPSQVCSDRPGNESYFLLLNNWEGELIIWSSLTGLQITIPTPCYQATARSSKTWVGTSDG